MNIVHLINELHEMYMQDKKITTKQKVIQYLHNLPTQQDYCLY